MKPRTQAKAPPEKIYCKTCNKAPGINEQYVSWKNNTYCVAHARDLVRSGKAKYEEVEVHVRTHKQEDAIRDALFAPIARAREITL